MGLAAEASAASVVNRYLLPHEQLHVTIRQHPAVLAGSGVTALAGLIAAPVLAQFIPARSDALNVAVWIAWGLLLLRVVFKVMDWLVGYFVVTSLRIMIVSGIFERQIAIIPLWLVNNLSYQRSPAGRLLGYGEFRVRYGRQSQMLQKLQYIPYPDELYLEIHRVISGLTARGSGAEPESDAEPDSGAESGGNDQEA